MKKEGRHSVSCNNAPAFAAGEGAPHPDRTCPFPTLYSILFISMATICAAFLSKTASKRSQKLFCQAKCCDFPSTIPALGSHCLRLRRKKDLKVSSQSVAEAVTRKAAPATG